MQCRYKVPTLQCCFFVGLLFICYVQTGQFVSDSLTDFSPDEVCGCGVLVQTLVLLHLLHQVLCHLLYQGRGVLV